MPGAIATNFARNFEPAFLESFVKMAGLDIEVKKGERLPDEVFGYVRQHGAERFMVLLDFGPGTHAFASPIDGTLAFHPFFGAAPDVAVAGPDEPGQRRDDESVG